MTTDQRLERIESLLERIAVAVEADPKSMWKVPVDFKPATKPQPASDPDFEKMMTGD